jgi:hypothetical protein
MMLAHNNYSRTQLPFHHQHYIAAHHAPTHHAFDLDDLDASSQYPNANNTFLPSNALFAPVPPRTPNHSQSQSQSLAQVPDLMPSTESWMMQPQQQQQQHHHHQTPRTARRLDHQRESSLSSLGSNGPASPFNPNTSNPHIAVADSAADSYNDLTAGGDGNYAYTLGKPMALNDAFYAPFQSIPATPSCANSNPHHHTAASLVDSLPNMSGPVQNTAKRLLPAPDLASTGSATKSHPASVASSVVGGDSPATPCFHEPEEDSARRRKNAYANNPNVPKLDRTMTDIYSDELYSPNFTITSASPPAQAQLSMSPSNDLFAQRLQAANSQHLSAVQSPASAGTRNNSPFRHGSPLAPNLQDFSQGPTQLLQQQQQQQSQQQQQQQPPQHQQQPQIRLNSAQQLREKRKQEQDAEALRQHFNRNANHQSQQQGTPSTISPKDAMLEFNDTDESNFPLFPPHETNMGLDHLNKSAANQAAVQNVQNMQAAAVAAAAATPLQHAFNFSMPSNVQLPQQYPFIARPTQQQATPPVSNFSRVGSTETESSEVSMARPARTVADGGTYTCTYHGCTLRFETPALLQKHKREGHRQTNTLSAVRPSVPAAASPGIPDTLVGSQAGPHRCDRINPSTGKPCATVFSRPYDLTRHEDTIHNARKQKVRCNMCTEEKTFSRADALTRHYRVCHPEVELPGKHRRRGGAGL